MEIRTLIIYGTIEQYLVIYKGKDAMNRWKEFKAGKLAKPCVVQHDELPGEHLVWVWCSDGVIRGPFSRKEFDEVEIFETVASIILIDSPVETASTDSKEVDELRASIVKKDAIIQKLIVEKEVLIAEKESLSVKVEVTE
jgi:hypothetical protein